MKTDNADTIDSVQRLIISYAGTTGAQAQTLKLHASGTGGIAALSDALSDEMIGYCLLRETDTVDNSVTVKFVFIFWLGDHSNRMQKARTSTHMGYIKKFIGVRTQIFEPGDCVLFILLIVACSCPFVGCFPDPVTDNDVLINFLATAIPCGSECDAKERDYA